MADNQISLEQAVKMTTLYRNQKENILADPYKGQNILCTCETFDRAAIDALLSETDCVKIRVYYGMSDDLQIHAIIVGVNSNNEDILPSLGSAPSSTDPTITEDGERCPDECPPSSPLNS